jgi:hypothetical protein
LLDVGRTGAALVGAEGLAGLVGAGAAEEAGLLELTGAGLLVIGDGVVAAGAEGLVAAGRGLVTVPAGRGCKSGASLEDASADPAAPARCACTGEINPTARANINADEEHSLKVFTDGTVVKLR